MNDVLTLLNNDRDSLSTTYTRCCQTVTSPASMQLVENRQHQARSGRPKRMTQRNRATVDVGPGAIETQLFLNREILRRKCFVDFDQIDVGKFQAGLFECLAGSRHWSNSHDLRFDAGVGPTDDSTPRLQVCS